MKWQRVADKRAPSKPHEVLTGTKTGNKWHYEVLTHWPDGVWSDNLTEDPIEDEFLPSLWAEIEEPANEAREEQSDGRL